VKTPAPERAASRKKLAAKGQALGDGTAPVPDLAYLRKAIRAKGRVDPAKWPALKRLIVKRARQLKATSAPGVKGTWPFQGANDGGTVIDLAFRYKHGWIRVGGEADKHVALAKKADGEGRHADAINHLGNALPHVTDKSAAHHLNELKKEMAARQMGVPYKAKPLPKRLRAMANDGGAIDLATMTRRMPVVRGPADVQLSRSAPGMITAMHKSSGLKIGMITPEGKGYAGKHADGTETGASGSQQGALAGLIDHHNKRARGFPAAQQDGTASYAGGQGGAVDLAGALPFTSANSSMDGPRVTTMGAGKPAATAKPSGGLSPYAAGIYRKLLAKGMKSAVAMAMAKRAGAMHAKASAA
jgi:hypothetical protein